MSEARRVFLRRMDSLRIGLGSEAASQLAPREIDHNSVASLFRQGMAVVGFVALEDFIKKRATEALETISQCGIPFHRLPEKLRRATTHEALNSISFQIKIRDGSARELYAQEAAEAIFSTKNENYLLYKHAFGYDSSNINSESVSKILSSFSISSGWNKMTTLSANLDLGLDLLTRFNSCAQLRHRAAHVPEANIAVGDLESLWKDCMAIAISFDAFVERSVSSFQRRDYQVLDGTTAVEASDIHYTKIKYFEGHWKLFRKGSVRAIKKCASLSEMNDYISGKRWDVPSLHVFYDETRFASSWRVTN